MKNRYFCRKFDEADAKYLLKKESAFVGVEGKDKVITDSKKTEVQKRSGSVYPLWLQYGEAGVFVTFFHKNYPLLQSFPCKKLNYLAQKH